MKNLFPYLLLSLFTLITFSAKEAVYTPASANCIIVTNSNDSGPGSLREALTLADADVSIDSILFNIPGAGVHTINLLSELPELRRFLVIDGTSQPGNFPMVGLIEIDIAGSNSLDTILKGKDNGIFGLVLKGTFVTYGIEGFGMFIGEKDKGNVITNCSRGISIHGIASSGRVTKIKYNIIGSDINYQSAIDWMTPPLFVPLVGIFLSFTDYPIVEHNTLLYHLFTGIRVDNTQEASIYKNHIGVDSLFTTDMSFFPSFTGLPSATGIIFSSSSSDAIMEENVIVKQDTAMFFNSVSPWGPAQRNTFTKNSIYCNTTGMIVSAGDQGSILPPQISTANTNEITGTASPNETIEVFVETQVNNWSCNNCSAGSPQGETYLGTTTSDVTGDWILSSSSFLTPLTTGQNIIATTTDANGNTSEYSVCSSVQLGLTSNPCSIEIPLQIGWNLISTNCEPNELNMDSIFTDIASQLIEVKDLNDSYVPLLGYNHIGDWDIQSSYLVKMINNDTLNIQGVSVDPISTPIILTEGWNMGTYLLDSIGNPDSVWANIASNIIEVKTLSESYVPSSGSSTLDTLKPYQGFYFNLLNADTLIYDSSNSGF